ncbi:FAST kinase domain-containing protein 5 [Operophtera brumata]|uniref:FAST kinase domain-containing protein 5 n=1 Tax=Operophtera brumata TaxID=104452 RepID=A0A0L7LD22_OPEBR|nr:FAST kinase domain-containing protein 5 [Operophtera brumata]
MYMEHENSYAYNIMRNKGYAMDIETAKETTSLNKESLHKLLEENWSNKQPSQIFEAYTKLSVYCSENNLCISNTMFDNFIDDLTDVINKATDTELVSIFYALNMWPETESIRTRNLIEVWAALDEACLERVNKWSPDETLSYIALFYMLNVSKVSDFCRKGLIKLAAKAKGLTRKQLVQTMFFVGIQRKSPHDVHNLEVHLSNNFTQFSVDELAIMSMGFFKSRTPIRSVELVKNIMLKIMENPKDIHEVSLAALLKVIRYSMKMPLDDCIALMYELLGVLKHEVPRLSVMCNVHIALLGTSKLILHQDCLDSVAETSLKRFSETRLKDLERLALTFGTLNYLPQTQEDFLDRIIEELRKPERQSEIQSHGRTFACCVSYLGLLGKYPVDLISQVLSEEFLKNTYGRPIFTYGKEILVLNNTAEIFCKEQEINRLKRKETIMLAKKYTDYMPSEDFKKQYNVDLFFTDLILCNSPEGTPLPVSMEKFSAFGLIRRPPDDNKWIVLVIAGRNGTIYGTENPTGPFQVKLRELQHLGYHTNLVIE